MEYQKQIMKRVMTECATFFGHLHQFCNKYHKTIFTKTEEINKNTAFPKKSNKQIKKRNQKIITKKIKNLKSTKKNKIESKATIPAFVLFIRSAKQSQQLRTKFSKMNGKDIADYCVKMWESLSNAEKKKYEIPMEKESLSYPKSEISSNEDVIFNDASVAPKIIQKKENEFQKYSKSQENQFEISYSEKSELKNNKKGKKWNFAAGILKNYNESCSNSEKMDE